MIAEMMESIHELPAANPLPEFIETCIPCPECHGSGFRLYDEVEYCRTCKGKQEVEIEVCGVCGQTENAKCPCDDEAEARQFGDVRTG